LFTGGKAQHIRGEKNFRSKHFLRAVRGRMGEKGENIPSFSSPFIGYQLFVFFSMRID
jgi:hypothetical protein